MRYHRWPYYQCKNFGNCSKADRHEVIELPLGAKPVCPGPNCRQALTRMNGHSAAPVPPAATESDGPPARGGGGPGLVALVVLLVLGLVVNVIWLLLPIRRPLSVQVSFPVVGHVGDTFDIPINVDPVSLEGLTLTVEGNLPADLVLDNVGRRLYGSAQRPGSYPIIIRASAPGFKNASASTTILIGSNRTMPTALSLQVPQQVQGHVGESLDVPLRVDPATVTSPAAASVAPSLTLTVSPAIQGHVGELLDVPVTLEPAGVADPAVAVDGDLPVGVTLDARAGRLHGVPQTSGSFKVIIRAGAPGYTDTQAPVQLIVAGATSPAEPAEPYDLVLAGSNTIGGVDAASQKGLARDLVDEFCRKRWPDAVPDRQVLKDVGRDDKDRVITYKAATGDLHRILIRPHGSRLAAEALQSIDPGTRADVGMSSTPLPELQAGFYEFVIALDAVAVIVNPDNPVVEMTLENLKNIFGPDPSLRGWDDGNPTRTYGRDPNSGTTGCFRAVTGIDEALEARHLGKESPIPYTGIPAGQPGHDGFEDTSKVIQKVATDPYAIGYVGHAANLPSSVKVVAIRPAPQYSAFLPNATTIRTMDYCLARELYFYLPHSARPLAADFIRFCLSEEGQAVVDDAGFIGFRSANLLARPLFGDRAPTALRSAVAGCDQVVLSFRFRPGSSDVLDAASSQNWRLLVDFLRLPDVATRHLVVAGFSDSSDAVAASYRNSGARAAAFTAQLARAGLGNPVDRTLGFGTDYPLCGDKGNPNSWEAQKNRRVDVYLAR